MRLPQLAFFVEHVTFTDTSGKKHGSAHWVSQICLLLQDSCCQVELAGQIFTEAGQLEAALQKELQPSSEPQLYAFDHIYSSNPQTSFKIWHANNASAAVLYGTPGTACFQDLHKLLKDAVTRQYTEGLSFLQSLYDHKAVR